MVRGDTNHGGGEKILLYPGGVGEVGIGVYGNELRLHSDNPGAKVSFGTQDNFGVFTEKCQVRKKWRLRFFHLWQPLGKWNHLCQ